MATHAVADPGWDRRRLIYGDWSWLIRDGLDVLRLAFIGGTIAFAVEGRSTAVGLTAASVVLLIARVIDLPRWFDFGLIVAMTLIAWGTALTLYGNYDFYDKIVHGVSPIGYAPVLYLLLVRLDVVPDPADALQERRYSRIAGIAVVTLAVGMAVGAGYEIVEFTSDWAFGTTFQEGNFDTMTDLIADTSGSLIGALFLTVWAIRGWSSRRVTVVPAPEPSRQVADRLRPSQPTTTTLAWQLTFAGLPIAAQSAVWIGAGVLLLALPTPTLRTLGIIVGGALVAWALFELVELIRHGDPEKRRLRLVEIAATAITGTLVLAWPAISQLALLYAVGAVSLVLSMVEVAALAMETRTRERVIGAVAAIAAFVFGIAMLARPESSFHAALTLVGVYLVVLGALRLVRALAARRDLRISQSSG